MYEILKWVGIHPLPTAEIIAICYLILISLFGFIQGREISLWPPRIGGRPIKPEMVSSNVNTLSVLDAIKYRKSVRSFLEKAVEVDKLNLILESARLAPSASNRQEWRFLVINDQDILSQIALASCIHSFIKNHPCIIAACADTDLHVMKCGQMSYPIDVAIALDHITLSAVALGLGTCWIGMFDETRVKKILKIPEGIRVVALMVLGYPTDPTPVEKKRLSLGQIVKYNRW